MVADCFKCKVPLAAGAPEQGPSTVGKRARRGQMAWKEDASGAGVSFISYRCPSCGHVRAVETKGN